MWSVLAGIFHITNSNDLPICHDDTESVFLVDNNTDSIQAKRPWKLVENVQKNVNKLGLSSGKLRTS